MRGYFTSSGFRGFVNGEWMLFASESDYIEYIEEGSYDDRSQIPSDL